VLPQIVYLGGGALDAAPEVRDFIARTGIPVAQTLMGLGTYPVGDKLSLQMLGMHGTVYANYAVDQVRCVGFLMHVHRASIRSSAKQLVAAGVQGVYACPRRLQSSCVWRNH
jgi:glyoxylate carboligase